jgi:hypothetical protein
MFWNLVNTSLLILAALLLYRFAPNIGAALKRFDERNRARIEQERADRSDRFAHFRHAMDVAGEEVEEIVETETIDRRTGNTMVCYLFDGELFATRAEAEAARAALIADKTRDFYRDLPAALTSRREDKLK